MRAESTLVVVGYHKISIFIRLIFVLYYERSNDLKLFLLIKKII